LLEKQSCAGTNVPAAETPKNIDFAEQKRGRTAKTGLAATTG